MEFARVQFEIRFTQILNFNNIFREKLSPYLKVSTSFQLHQNNSGITLVFDDDDFQLDCRWDRIIFLSQGNMHRFEEKLSPIKYLFEIFDLLSNLPSFGKLTHYISVVNTIKTIDQNWENVLKSYKEKYLNSNSISPIFETTLNDISITLETTLQDNKNISFTFGPYNSKNDILKRNLFPINPVDEINSEKYGFMTEIKIHEQIETISKNTFKEIMELSSKFHNKI